MLLDNTAKERSVYSFLTEHIGKTDSAVFDVVTGYFTIEALAMLAGEFDSKNAIGEHLKRFRLLLGNLASKNDLKHLQINLIDDGAASLTAAFKLSATAQAAIAFLQQNNVKVKTQKKQFCHAKAYIYRMENIQRCFSVVGSSNLTFSGIGKYAPKGNIELNVPDIPSPTHRALFDETVTWFEKLWEHSEVTDMIDIVGGKQRVVERIIEEIKKFYREYSPEDLYYKVLFELFKKDILAFEQNEDFQRQIKHLEDTDIWNVLYPFQKQGVLSVIRMLQQFGGAILADAVGLGKTWQTLAVIKFFELQGFKILLLAPKKLKQNWDQFKVGGHSRFEHDEIDFVLRFHTDLQGERLNSYDSHNLAWLKKQTKLLVVIDESHNLRNDKSSRYEFLVNNILKDIPEVKVLHLSATPINTKLTDIRNQFKLLVRGDNVGFARVGGLETAGNLEELFRQAQINFTLWSKQPNPKITDFIAKLSDAFFLLTDRLVVARTRAMIRHETNDLKFPAKQRPLNYFVPPGNIGLLNGLDEILMSLDKIFFAAYRPAEFMNAPADTGDTRTRALRDDKSRQRFLAKMMYFLLVKRLESSWQSLMQTLGTIWNKHKEALEKVDKFTTAPDANISPADETGAVAADEHNEELQQELNENDATLGKAKIKLSEIKDMAGFRLHLVNDIDAMDTLLKHLNTLKATIDAETTEQSSDKKLLKLMEIIREKQREKPDRKILIFTAYTSTAEYLFTELKKRGFTRLAMVSGTNNKTDDGFSNPKFEKILERFAPFTKLYNERVWDDVYAKAGIQKTATIGRKPAYPKPTFEAWQTLVREHDSGTAKLLDNPVDVLIATDCLSEGQNLQDADTVINYDIHWNPVRLIQRFGRIDRLGSPHDAVFGINFWPAPNYEKYLNLKGRVERRMAVMTLAGAEVDTEMTETFSDIIEGNPLDEKRTIRYKELLEKLKEATADDGDDQTRKLLELLRDEWRDEGETPGTLGLNNLSLEEFRQDLLDMLKQRANELEDIPNAVFTGFSLGSRPPRDAAPGIIALLGYERRADPAEAYSETYMLYRSPDGNNVMTNRADILAMLRAYKSAERYIPTELYEETENERNLLTRYADSLKQWFDKHAPQQQAISEIHDIFAGIKAPAHIRRDNFVEDKFQPKNFDLVTWFLVSE